MVGIYLHEAEKFNRTQVFTFGYLHQDQGFYDNPTWYSVRIRVIFGVWVCD